MTEETIIISAKDLVDYTVYGRKRNEFLFKRDFLLRHGAKEEDVHIKALKNSVDEVDRRLLPISEKVDKADLITIVPNKRRIEMLTKEIKGYKRNELDEALTRKKGSVYELLRERGSLTKRNFENRDDIAMLTILLNGIPRSDAVRIRDMMENGEETGIDISGLQKRKQQNVVTLANRLGFPLYAMNGTLTGKKKE
jgi:hypothetical protein